MSMDDPFDDQMPIDGKLVRREGVADMGDTLLATNAVAVEVYQSSCEFDVPFEGGEPEWRLARLIVYGDEGRKSMHMVHTHERATIEGPDEAGRWRVRYEPMAREVQREGMTRAELRVPDQVGETRTFEATFATP